MLRTFLFWIVGIIADIHEAIMQLNNSFEYNLSDKTLHFLVIGLLGMLFYFVVSPIFRWLSRKGWVDAISWIYVMTLIVVITFAIEIGQKVTKTGAMEFADIVFGVGGFLLISLVYFLLRGLLRLIFRPRHRE